MDADDADLSTGNALPEPDARTLAALFFPTPAQQRYVDLVSLKARARVMLERHSGWRLAHAIVQQSGLSNIADQFVQQPAALGVPDSELDALRPLTIQHLLHTEPLFKFWILKVPWLYLSQVFRLPDTAQPEHWSQPFSVSAPYGQIRWADTEPRFKSLRWINTPDLTNASNPLYFFQSLSCAYHLQQFIEAYTADWNIPAGAVPVICGIAETVVGGGGPTRSSMLLELFSTDEPKLGDRAMRPSLFLPLDTDLSALQRDLTSVCAMTQVLDTDSLVSTLAQERRVLVEPQRPAQSGLLAPDAAPARPPRSDARRSEPRAPAPRGRAPTAGLRAEEDERREVQATRPAYLRAGETTAGQNSSRRSALSSTMDPLLTRAALNVIIACRTALSQFVKTYNLPLPGPDDNVFTYIQRNNIVYNYGSDTILLMLYGCWEAVANYMIGVMGAQMLWSFPQPEVAGDLPNMTTVEQLLQPCERFRSSPNAVRTFYQLIGGPAGSEFGGDELLEEGAAALQRAGQRNLRGGLAMETATATWDRLSDLLSESLRDGRRRVQLGEDMDVVLQHRSGRYLEREREPGDTRDNDFEPQIENLERMDVVEVNARAPEMDVDAPDHFMGVKRRRDGPADPNGDRGKETANSIKELEAQLNKVRHDAEEMYQYIQKLPETVADYAHTIQAWATQYQTLMMDLTNKRKSEFVQVEQHESILAEYKIAFESESTLRPLLDLAQSLLGKGQNYRDHIQQQRQQIIDALKLIEGTDESLDALLGQLIAKQNETQPNPSSDASKIIQPPEGASASGSEPNEGIQNLTQQLEALQTQYNQCTGERKELQDALTKAETRQKDLESDLKRCNAEKTAQEAKFTTSSTELKEKIAELENIVRDGTEERVGHAKELANLREQLDKLTRTNDEKLTASNAIIRRLESENTTLRGMMETLQDQLRVLTNKSTDNDQLRTQMTNALTDLENARTLNQEKEREIADLKRRLADIETERDNFKQQLGVEAEQNRAMKDRMTQHDAEKAALSDQLRTAEEQYNASLRRIGDLEEQAKAMQRTIDALGDRQDDREIPERMDVEEARRPVSAVEDGRYAEASRELMLRVRTMYTAAVQFLENHSSNDPVPPSANQWIQNLASTDKENLKKLDDLVSQALAILTQQPYYVTASPQGKALQAAYDAVQEAGRAFVSRSNSLRDPSDRTNAVTTQLWDSISNLRIALMRRGERQTASSSTDTTCVNQSQDLWSAVVRVREMLSAQNIQSYGQRQLRAHTAAEEGRDGTGTALWEAVTRLHQLQHTVMPESSALNPTQRNAAVDGLWEAIARLNARACAMQHLETAAPGYGGGGEARAHATQELWEAVTRLAHVSRDARDQLRAAFPALEGSSSATAGLWDAITQLYRTTDSMRPLLHQHDPATAQQRDAAVDRLWEAITALNAAARSAGEQMQRVGVPVTEQQSAVTDLWEAISRLNVTAAHSHQYSWAPSSSISPDQQRVITELWNSISDLRGVTVRVHDQAQASSTLTPPQSQAITELWEAVATLGARINEAQDCVDLGTRGAAERCGGVITDLWSAIAQINRTAGRADALVCPTPIVTQDQLNAITELWATVSTLRRHSNAVQRQLERAGTLTPEQQRAADDLWGAITALHQRTQTLRADMRQGNREPQDYAAPITQLWEAVSAVREQARYVHTVLESSNALSTSDAVTNLWAAISSLNRITESRPMQRASLTTTSDGSCSSASTDLWGAVATLNRMVRDAHASGSSSADHFRSPEAVTELWNAVSALNRISTQSAAAPSGLHGGCEPAVTALWDAISVVRNTASAQQAAAASSSSASPSPCDAPITQLWEAASTVRAMAAKTKDPGLPGSSGHTQCQQAVTDLWNAITNARGASRQLLSEVGASRQMLSGCQSTQELWEAAMKLAQTLVHAQDRMDRNKDLLQSVIQTRCDIVIKELWESALSVSERNRYRQLSESSALYSRHESESRAIQGLWEAILQIKDSVVLAESGDLMMQRIWNVYREQFRVLYQNEEDQLPETSPFGNIDDMLREVKRRMKVVQTEAIKESEVYKELEQELGGTRMTELERLERNRELLTALDRARFNRIRNQGGRDPSAEYYSIQALLTGINASRELQNDINAIWLDTDASEAVKLDRIKSLVSETLGFDWPQTSELREAQEKILQLQDRLRAFTEEDKNDEWHLRYQVARSGVVFSDQLVTAIQSALNCVLETQMSQLLAEPRTATGRVEGPDFESEYPEGYEFPLDNPAVKPTEESKPDPLGALTSTQMDRRSITASDMLCEYCTWSKDPAKLEQLKSCVITLASSKCLPLRAGVW